MIVSRRWNSSSPPSLVLDEPIPNAEMTLYVDGSRLQKPEGGFAAGFTIADDTSVLYSETLDPGVNSGQSTKLIALIKACELAEGKTVNIYTDSCYVYRNVYDLGFLWEHRSFMTSFGKVVKHADLIQDLLEKVKLPKAIAVIKWQAHQQADVAARQAALLLLQESSKDTECQWIL
ncbi:ribonuclease H-like [Pseudophryne corroboree]|uniref:ribonuclease H-like n=1 Tax=Pseudophryne corroboree TaxID=495146 RepID=UPI0030821D19